MKSWCSMPKKTPSNRASRQRRKTRRKATWTRSSGSCKTTVGRNRRPLSRGATNPTTRPSKSSANYCVTTQPGCWSCETNWSGCLPPGTGRAAKGSEPSILTAWNGNSSFDTDRTGRGSILIPNLCVSIFGSIQPDKLIGYLEQASNALAKYDKLFPALALILHLIECADTERYGPVTEKAALRAAAWCEYLEASCPALLRTPDRRWLTGRPGFGGQNPRKEITGRFHTAGCTSPSVALSDH